MECLPLLRICARLVDLHDAERLPGNSPIFVQEDRRGLRDGRYLDLAAGVLDALRVNAHSSGNAFIGFDALLIAVKERRSDVDPEDLRYVLNVLSRPTEFWITDRQSDIPRLISDKASELVEKTYFAEDYRLAPSGRAAVAVAANIQGFAYAEGDVLKLLRAIEAGDFASVPVFCATILDSIRYESVDLRQVIERGFVDHYSAVYKDQLPRYRQVIRQSSDLLRQADAKLKAWRSPENDDLDETIDIDLYELEQHLLQVYQALEAFGRELSDLASLAAQRRVSVVAPPNFLAAALQLVKQPPSKDQLSYLFRQFGPLSLDGLFPSPMDVLGKVRIPAVRAVQTNQFDTAGAASLKNNIRAVFLEEFGPEIRARLLQGPLSLAESIEQGWCQLDGAPVLEELVGVYVSPWTLDTDSPLQIRIPIELLDHGHAALGDVVCHDLELAFYEGDVSP